MRVHGGLVCANAGGAGRWDTEPELNAPKRHPDVAIVYEGEQYKNNYSFNFYHRLGYQPSRIKFEVGMRGIGPGANNAIDTRTIVEVPLETYVAETDSYFGYQNTENSPFHWRAVYHHNIAFNQVNGEWMERDRSDIYLRCRIYL